MNEEPARQTSFLPVERLLADAVSAGAFPGAAWGIAQAGRALCTGAVGRFTYEPNSRAVTPETAYDLASVSKVVATTAMAMLLHQRGQLDLHMPLGDVLPGFVISSERGSGRHLVTLRMLLAHASGLPAYEPFFRSHQDAAGLLRACFQLSLVARPGTVASYSDPGFILLGKALEVLAGESLDRFCTREIFIPLGMLSTSYRPLPSARAAIPPTERDEHFGRGMVQGVVHDENCFVLGGCSGHAGLFAPVGDVLRFAEAIHSALRPRFETDAGLFNPATAHLFSRRAGPAGSSRALGWDTPESPSSSGSHFGPRSIGHLGYTGTSLWLDPDRDLSVVLLTNRTWPTRDNNLIREVRPAFHDLVYKLL